MTYIKIKNAGEIDINALTLLGASSKVGDESKIGFFGSGNKYALATFLRHDVGVRIFSGAQEFVIDTEQVNFRGQAFSRIIINGIQTSLTTRTGPEWELWMAMREFLCNALDEGEASWEEVDAIEGAEPGTTAIYLENVAALATVFGNIEDVLITGVEPLVTASTSYGLVAIYDRQNGRIYRKGICCNTDRDESLFAYSFENVDINESRVASSDYQIYERITSALAAVDDGEIVNRVMSAMRNGNHEDLREHRILEGEYWGAAYCRERLSAAWRDYFIRQNMVCCPVACVPFMPPEDIATFLVLPTGFYQKLISDWPDIPHVGEGATEWVEATEPPALAARINAALMELKALGLTGGRDYAIRWVNFVNENTVLCAGERDSLEIFVSVKERPEVDYEAGMLEEIVHKMTGYGDGSRALQTLLFVKWLAAERRAARNEQFVTLIESAVALRAGK